MNSLGLTEEQRKVIESLEGQYVGRICTQHKDLYRVITETGEITAEVSGKYRYQVTDISEFPAVGDYVLLDRPDDTKGNGILHQVLPRKSVFSRKVAGLRTDTQVVAANIDTIFICMSMNQDYNLRRLERYLSISWESGATPVIVLTKADVCQNVPEILHEVGSVAVGVDILVTTTKKTEGYDSVIKYLVPGKTVALIGSSGVGKSTLINRLYGEDVLVTNEIRNDDKGRHTTTRRELIILPNGATVIDTPGMRELGIVTGDVSKSFTDIEELILRCKYRNCSHGNEPGCALRTAIEDGSLSQDRLDNYWKIQKEMKYAGLDSKQVEKEKIHAMFGSIGGMKQARKMVKEKNVRK